MTRVNGNKDREGSALLFVMLVMIVVSIIGLGQLTNAKLAGLDAARAAHHTQFSLLADMGLREFRAMVMNERNRRNFDSLKVVSTAADPVVFKREWVRDDQGDEIGGYKVFVTEAEAGDPAEAHYKIRCVAYDENFKERAQVESYIRLTTVSEDVWGSDDEGGVLFVTNDKIWGSIRSNNPFYISGTPCITGTTKTSANHNVIDGRNSTDAPANIFNGGVLFDLPELPFDPTLVTGLASDAEQTVKDGSEIEFLSNGDYAVTEKITTSVTTDGWIYKSGGSWYFVENQTDVPYWGSREQEYTYTRDVETTTTDTFAIDDLGDSGKDSDNIIYVDGSVTVKGEVAGTVSVVAADSIFIDQSIVYASQAGDPDPSNWAEGDEPEIYERLGLYATKKVMASGVPGQDIDIHAAIYVSDGNDSSYYRGFCVKDYKDYYGSPDINFYGSIIQNQRGAVGTSGGYGFYKNYHQDGRFLTSPPPGSPLSSPEFFGWKLTRLGS